MPTHYSYHPVTGTRRDPRNVDYWYVEANIGHRWETVLSRTTDKAAAQAKLRELRAEGTEARMRKTWGLPPGESRGTFLPGRG